MKLAKSYDPILYESNIYALWEKRGIFQPSKQGTPFAIVMPPPNANANMHIGYSLTAALEDITARYHRAKGESVLLLPGADHAGFETQSVYEKQLARVGKSRFDFSRGELYKQIWDFVASNKTNFTTQMARTGVSCDWTRSTFTLDDKIVRRAYTTFQKMWHEGLIYRGERLVNFCTFHGTAFADIEVVYKEEQGKLWEVRYPLVDGSGEVVIATTRPETMFGDTAVAVHPSDERYQNLVGKTVKLPLTDRELPILADDFVDKEFGTGAVKITPAHDPNDFEVGKRHDLPFVSVIDHEGKLMNVPETYRGLTVEAGRQKVVNELEAQGYLINVSDHLHNVGHCYKCDTVIQPLLREQWFVDMQPLATRAITVLKENRITFYPEAKKDQLITYLQGLRDWNISRQIAWGIPIPAFQSIDEPDDWIYDERVEEEQIVVNGKTYRRDPDVFDTWFSSSSWPYATLDYPDGEDFKKFYPLSLMETGGEILYPWVARMIMLGLYVTDEIPFTAVYIHGYVMAEDGSKMSKSIGNVVDPIPIIDQYGSDALRLGIISGRTAAVNRGYDQRRVEEGRNFCNKLWNIARYIDDQLGDGPKEGRAVAKTAVDHWILQRLEATQQKLMRDLDYYRFSEAYESLYHFVWDDFADWYIEASKAAPNRPLLAAILESVLVLAHPFVPFVTETIWQTLVWEKDSLLAAKQLSNALPSNTKAAGEFTEIQKIVTEIRFILNALKVSNVSLSYNDVPLLRDNATIIKQLTKLKSIQAASSGSGIYLTSTSYGCWLDIDLATAQSYLRELTTRQDRQAALIEQLEARLKNTSYINNAPQEVVAQTQQQLEEAIQQLQKLADEYRRFSNASR